MDLITFCRLHGILINHLPPVGVWKRYPTEDHPRSSNGAVKYMGNFAHVQNHAVMLEPVTWQAEDGQKIDPQKIVRLAKVQEDKTAKLQAEAASKAAWIVNQCQIGKHEYLKAKGFPDEQGLVWVSKESKLLVIPMRIENRLVGCQLIDTDGSKKFLFGQKTAGAAMVFDNKGMNILCEGYATGLSIKEVLKNLKRRYTIHVCFSAGNMLEVGRQLENPLVIADNDAIGISTAKKIASRYWIGEAGEDFNDTEQRIGTELAAESLRGFL